jgi:hypothetical protein
MFWIAAKIRRWCSDLSMAPIHLATPDQVSDRIL